MARNYQVVPRMRNGFRAPSLMATAGAVGNYIGKAYKRYKQQSNSRSTRESSDHINTFQDSSDRLYSRRRPNKRRSRKARRWYRSVTKVINSNLADHNFRRVLAGTASSTANNQGSFGVVLNSCSGSPGYDDLQVIINSLSGALANSLTSKYHLRSSLLDLTVTAKSTNTAVTFCDFYYVYCRKDVMNSDGNDLQAFWALQAASVTGGVVTDVNGYGYTPFQTPGFCQSFIIQKVQRVSLTAGQTCSLMMKNNRLRVFNTEDVDAPLTFRKGMSRGLLCVISGGPDASGVPSAVSVSYNVSRTYCLNVLEDSSASYVTL